MLRITNKRSLITALAGLALLGFCLFVVLLFWNLRPRGTEALHHQVKQEFNSFMPPAGAVSVQNNDIFNFRGVLVGAYYTTSLTFSDVRQHYEKQLTQNGYQFREFKRLESWGKNYGEENAVYCKGDLMAALYNPGTVPVKTKYQFSFSISSNAFECR